MCLCKAQVNNEKLFFPQNMIIQLKSSFLNVYIDYMGHYAKKNQILMKSTNLTATTFNVDLISINLVYYNLILSTKNVKSKKSLPTLNKQAEKKLFK